MKKRLEYLSCFNVEITDSHIKTTLIGEKSPITGYLYSQIDIEALENIRKIVVSLILFHGLSARVASEGRGFSSKFPYPSKRAISRAMDVIEYKNWTEEMTDQVSALRRGIAVTGYFRFQS